MQAELKKRSVLGGQDLLFVITNPFVAALAAQAESKKRFSEAGEEGAAERPLMIRTGKAKTDGEPCWLERVGRSGAKRGLGGLAARAERCRVLAHGALLLPPWLPCSCSC